MKNVEEKLLCTLHCPGEFNKDIAEMFSVKAANTVVQDIALHCNVQGQLSIGKVGLIGELVRIKAQEVIYKVL